MKGLFYNNEYRMVHLWNLPILFMQMLMKFEQFVLFLTVHATDTRFDLVRMSKDVDSAINYHIATKLHPNSSWLSTPDILLWVLLCIERQRKYVNCHD